jgi:glycogen debranching enzyme
MGKKGFSMVGNQSTRLVCGEDGDSFWEKYPVLEIFMRAADSFVKHVDGTVQIWAANRDWFLEEWGRDTFISLPGILLVTKRFGEAKR